jgi:hypothetical protein
LPLPLFRSAELKAALIVPPTVFAQGALLAQDAKTLRGIVDLMGACGDYAVTTRAAKFRGDTEELENIKSTVETQTKPDRVRMAYLFRDLLYAAHDGTQCVPYWN